MYPPGLASIHSAFTARYSAAETKRTVYGRTSVSGTCYSGLVKKGAGSGSIFYRRGRTLAGPFMNRAPEKIETPGVPRRQFTIARSAFHRRLNCPQAPWRFSPILTSKWVKKERPPAGAAHPAARKRRNTYPRNLFMRNKKFIYRRKRYGFSSDQGAGNAPQDVP